MRLDKSGWRSGKSCRRSKRCRAAREPARGRSRHRRTSCRQRRYDARVPTMCVLSSDADVCVCGAGLRIVRRSQGRAVAVRSASLGFVLGAIEPQLNRCEGCLNKVAVRRTKPHHTIGQCSYIKLLAINGSQRITPPEGARLACSPAQAGTPSLRVRRQNR
jgi:hypothetical protein